ncbi:integrase [Gossypium australe]|uniref:Integrase n=1 Tax=Gossypium australe TaxID=47621 RepID=A0A5B6WV14_9ROSI|nr:integrase [Gossypium australe]
MDCDISLYFRNRICVLINFEIIRDTLHEAHNSSDKMCNDLKQSYWWLERKCEILELYRDVQCVNSSKLNIKFCSSYYDLLVNSTHFILVRIDYSLGKVVELYVFEIHEAMEDILQCCIIEFEDSWENIYYWLNLLIITTMSLVLKWYRLKLFTDENVEPHYTS